MAVEREKNRLILEKCQQILTELLKDEDNKYCVDCDAKSPRWASWNIGIFLCIRCAGIHRNLGVHISKVKSVNLDSWTPQQVASIQQMGNSRARAVYEANLQDNFRRPQADSALEQFIRAKYEAKKYIAREWVPPQLPNPTWDLEMEKQLRKKKDKKCVAGNIEFPSNIKNISPKMNGESPKPLPKAPRGTSYSPSSSHSTKLSGNESSKNGESELSKQSGTVDLLGLDSFPTTSSNDGTHNCENNDIFGDFLAAPPAITSEVEPVTVSESKDSQAAIKLEESSFFNQKQPDPVSEKLSKDSILALYNQAPPQAQQPQAIYGSGGGGGLFIGSVGMSVVPSGGQLGVMMPAQQIMSAPAQQQPNMMFFQQANGVAAGPPIAMKPQFFPQIGGASVYPMVPGSLQLSADNPFSQVQSHMNNLSIGGMTAPVLHQHQMQNMPSSANVMLNNLSMQSVNGLSPNPSQSNTLSTNLWQ